MIMENISMSNVVFIIGLLYVDCNFVFMVLVISVVGFVCFGGIDGSVLFELEELGCVGCYVVYLE